MVVWYGTYEILTVLSLTIYILFEASISDEEIQQIQGMSSISHPFLALRLNV